MRRLASASFIALLALAGACPDDCDNDSPGTYPTASGRWQLSLGDLQFDPCERPGQNSTPDDEAMLAGTRWCPAIDCAVDGNCQAHIDSDVLRECYDFVVDGPGVSDDGCLEITGSGELLWRFAPKPCVHDGIFLPEQITIHGADGPEIHGRLVSYLDDMALHYLSPETGTFPTDTTQPTNAAHIKVLADQRVHLVIDLRIGERRVAWPDEGTLVVRGRDRQNFGDRRGWG